MLKRTGVHITVFFVLIMICFPVLADAGDTAARPKIGVALSGGGARGAAHIGVLQVLEEMHVPIDFIAGTSMGAIIGGLYSCGVPLEDLTRMTETVDWIEIFSDSTARQDMLYRQKPGPENYLVTFTIDSHEGVRLPSGIIEGKRLDLLLRSFALQAGDDFNEFPIPFSAVATDIVTGEMVVLHSGDLAGSMRASMAIPAFFSPVEIDGRLLVDGGIARNLPVDVVRDMGADVVIAVNIGTPLSTRDKLEDFIGIVHQTTNFMTNSNVEVQIGGMGSGDILIVPELDDISTQDFERMNDAIAVGRSAAMQTSDKLQMLSLPQPEYRSHRQHQLEKTRPIEQIEFVDVDQEPVAGTRYLEEKIRNRIQDRVDVNLLAYDIFQVYEREDLDDLDFTLVETDGHRGILLKPQKKRYLQHRIRAGIQLANDLEGDNSYQFLVDYRLMNINRLAAEWKNEVLFGEVRSIRTELYQPLDPYAWKLFVAPYLQYWASPLGVYEDSSKVAEYDLYKRTLGMDLGLQLAQHGELRAGVFRGKYDADVKTGDPELPEYRTNDGAYRLELVLDRLDDMDFPRHGILLSLKYIDGRKTLGSDVSYRQWEASLLKPVTFDRHTLLLRGRWSAASGTKDTVSMVSFLGGFLNLSGLKPDQLYGHDLAFAGVAYMYNVMRLPAMMGKNLYVGASYEAGNVWQDHCRVNVHDVIYAGSVFLSADTIMGPVHIGVGHTDSNDNAVYVYLGRFY